MPKSIWSDEDKRTIHIALCQLRLGRDVLEIVAADNFATDQVGEAIREVEAMKDLEAEE